MGSIAAQRWEEGNRKSGDKEQGRKGVALCWRLRQEDHRFKANLGTEFKVSLGSVVRLYLKIKSEKRD